jgi:glycosyltransferase involved in cell wall biosynthesis
MSRSIRVALFTDSLHPSGVGQVMETLARSLPRYRYILYLACAAHPGADALAERLAPYVAGTARCTVRDDSEDLEALHALVRQLGDWKIDLFHNHIGATWEGAWGTLAARCARVPVVVATEHLPNVLQIPHELEYRRRINGLLDRLFAVSESVRQSLVAARLASPEKIVTVENGIEARRPCETRAEARASLGLPANVPVALFLGRLVPQKDPAALLQATRRLRRSGQPLHVLLAGDGPLRADLEEQARQLRIEEQVQFLGNRNDVDRLLAAADVLAMSSRFEGLPLAALEAMSMGLPVVGCDAPGVRDAVEHDVTGWLAPVGDEEGLAQGLLRAVAGEPGRRWAEAARHRFAQRFTAQRMAAQYDRQYTGALSPLAGTFPGKNGSSSPPEEGSDVRLHSDRAGGSRPALAPAPARA